MTEARAQEIRAQLERIVSSRELGDSQRLREFLNYVVDQALSGRRGGIKQYEIAVEGLGYGRDFDPASNPSVRIMARRLRRALKHYYANSGIADPIRIRLPKGGYVPEFFDNLEEADSDAAEFTEKAAEMMAANIGEPSIAVFELEVLGSREADAVIATGLTSELLVALTRFAGITVMGPFSLASQPPLHWRQVYRDYGAMFALKGWIQTQNSVVRITMELIDTHTGHGQWARKFQYDLGEASLFDIQDEIAGLVSGAVADSVGQVFRQVTADSYPRHIKFSDVTRAVFTYHHAWITHFPDVWQQAYQELGKALARYPENALLLALQGNVHYADALHELDIDPQSTGKMERLTKKALALDPTLQVAQYNLVVINAFSGNAEQCVSAARKAVTMNPNHARILAGSAIATSSVGAYELAKELIERAKRLNPQYPGFYLFPEFLVNLVNGDYGQAWEDAQLIRTPGLFCQPEIRATALGMLGRVEEARPHLEELLQIKPDFLQRPREYIRLLFVTDEHVDAVWDGLVKAGIEKAAG